MDQQKKVHPSILKFKDFVHEHPKMLEEVRNGEYTLQEFFEEWYLLGENDPRWNQYKEARIPDAEKQNSKLDWTTQLTNMLKKVDPNQLDAQITNLSKALGAIQGVLSQFQKTQSLSSPTAERPPHPFQFRKD